MRNKFLILFILTAIYSFAQRPKVAFVLSGGGARGFAHVGALKVLEEVGFKPDIITGTSMGSVIGGMYAIGYRSDSLQKIIHQTDWDDVVYDKQSRTELNTLERTRYDRYIVKLNFQGTKILAYNGLVKGTKIHNMLSRLSFPASNTNNFYKFQTSFACVATNIQNGNKVVLDKGNLADAIRASMAIPTLFTSVEINNQILVDGGMTQNYPIIEAVNMGADIIIGVDVGSKSTKEELGSFVNIIMESLFLHGYQNYEAEKKYLTINIKPELYNFTPLDFTEGDTIIKLGEIAARKQLDELITLRKSVYGNAPIAPVTTNHKLLDRKYKIKNIEVNGLKNISRIQINGILDRVQGKDISSSELNEMIKKLENTNFFDRIIYHFNNIDDRGNLIINVAEKPNGEFDIGINYNNYHEASLLTGLAYNNLLIKGTHLRADLRLSSSPRFDASYYYQTPFIALIGVEGSMSYIKQGLYSNNQLVSNVFSFLSSIYLKSKFNINNHQFFAIGFGLEKISNESDVIISLNNGKLTNTKQSNNIVLQYRQDSRDDEYIPTTGGRVLFDFYVANNDFNVKKTWFNALLRTEKHVKIGNRFHVSNYIDVGFNDGNYQDGNYQFQFSMGGMLDMKFRNYIPLSGFNFGQSVTRNMAHYRLKPGFLLFKNNYVCVLGEVAKANTYAEDIIKPQNIIFAYGASYEYRSPIGPMQFNVSRSNVNNEFYFYLNIGYWF